MKTTKIFSQRLNMSGSLKSPPLLMQDHWLTCHCPQVCLPFSTSNTTCTDQNIAPQPLAVHFHHDNNIDAASIEKLRAATTLEVNKC